MLFLFDRFARLMPFLISFQLVDIRVHFDMSCISILRKPCMSLGRSTLHPYCMDLLLKISNEIAIFHFIF